MVPRLLIFLVALLLAILSIFIGLRVAGPSDYRTALGVVEVSINPSSQGVVEAYVPIADWGVRAYPFSAPVTIHIEPRGVDRQALLAMVDNSSSLLAAAERDLRSAVIISSLRSLFAIMFVSLLVLPITYIISKQFMVSGKDLVLFTIMPSLLALLISACIAALMLASFNPASLERPSYWANGGELPGLLQFASQSERVSSSYRSSVSKGLREFAGALSGRAIGNNGQQALLVSDLHNNTLSIAEIKKLADHRPVFAVGDFTHEGGSAENKKMLRAVKDLGRPLVVVSGNHDTQSLMIKMAQSGAIVLSEKGPLLRENVKNPMIVVDGMKVFGVADPNQGNATIERKTPLSMTQKKVFLSNLSQKIRRLGPNIVLIHDSGLAASLASSLRDLPITFLTGHNHLQEVSRWGQAVIVNGGTAGAGGLFGVGREEVGFARLYLAGSQLSAVDLIRLEPFSGDGQAERITFSADETCQKVDDHCYYYQQRPQQ